MNATDERPTTPLARRIAARQPKPEPPKPAWFKNLQAKETTGLILR